MDRIRVGQLLDNYLQVLNSARIRYVFSGESGLAGKCDEHRETAEYLLVRWQGGWAEDNMKDALRMELGLLWASGFVGREAEEIGAAFGEVCRRMSIATQ